MAELPFWHIQRFVSCHTTLCNNFLVSKVPKNPERTDLEFNDASTSYTIKNKINVAGSMASGLILAFFTGADAIFPSLWFAQCTVHIVHVCWQLRMLIIIFAVFEQGGLATYGDLNRDDKGKYKRECLEWGLDKTKGSTVCIKFVGYSRNSRPANRYNQPSTVATTTSLSIGKRWGEAHWRIDTSFWMYNVIFQN